MKASIRFGLVAGIIGLVLNICVAFVFGFCGPIVTIVAGAVAGYFGSRAEPSFSKADSTRNGAIAGAITGGFMLVGQLIGGMISLALAQGIGMDLGLNVIPNQYANSEELIAYYGGGFGIACCIGVGDVIVGGVAGGIAGYLISPLQTPIGN